jgi:DNA-binding transcriptional LysR family regulator
MQIDTSASGDECMTHSLDSRDAQRAQRPTVHELEVLRAIVSTGKTTLAANALGISQPSVSRVVAMLEARLGEAIFVRKKGRLVPTAKALALDARAAIIVDLLDQLTTPAPTRSMVDDIRIAAAPTLANEFLPRMIAMFLKSHRSTHVQVDIETSTDCLAAVADGHADFGVVDQAPIRDGVRFEIFRTAVPHVLLPKGHRLRTYATLSPKHLAGENVIALSRRFPLRTKVDAALAAERVSMNVVAETTTSQFLAEMVRNGAGIGVVNPFPLELGAVKALLFRPFEIGVRLDTAIAVSSRTPLTPAARDLVNFIRAEQPVGRYSTAVS